MRDSKSLPPRHSPPSLFKGGPVDRGSKADFPLSANFNQGRASFLRALDNRITANQNPVRRVVEKIFGLFAG